MSWWRKSKEHPVTFTATTSIARGQMCVVDFEKGTIAPATRHVTEPCCMCAICEAARGR